VGRLTGGTKQQKKKSCGSSTHRYIGRETGDARGLKKKIHACPKGEVQASRLVGKTAAKRKGHGRGGVYSALERGAGGILEAYNGKSGLPWGGQEGGEKTIHLNGNLHVPKKGLAQKNRCSKKKKKQGGGGNRVPCELTSSYKKGKELQGTLGQKGAGGRSKKKRKAR